MLLLAYNFRKVSKFNFIGVYYESYRTSQNKIKWIKNKLNTDDYAVAWIAFIKGLIIGSLITYYIS